MRDTDLPPGGTLNISSLATPGSAYEARFALSRLAASLAHALGTPLQVISGRAALAQGSTDLEEAQKHVTIIVRKCRELSEFLQTTVATLRDPEAELSSVNVAQFTRETIEHVTGAAPCREAWVGTGLEIAWVTNVPPAWCGRIRALPLAETLVSLVQSTLHRHAVGPLTVTMSHSPLARDEATLEVEFEWSGPAVDPVIQVHLSDPWRLRADAPERLETLAFVAAFEAARQNGGSLSFPTSNSVRLTWPVRHIAPPATSGAER